ncbi:sel1 repeat family protein [Thalassotalea litorea]|uniref:Sel1 repeat family protein n=1 Tax=Thalassotalea litorea TaxID=2020715 RepID=A0A5R9IDD2_9GAMM|nr:tetratricopeptide repeat protein [Thalassotalea litorea]TLU61605.1 sel1 repeat family protein [Thalassotalea litorea]
MTVTKKRFAMLVAGTLLSMSVVLPASAGYEEAVDYMNRGQFDMAIEELKPLVMLGYPPALYQQGVLYEHGFGVQKNQQKAFKLYERAAGRSVPEAQFAVAQMYAEGRGTKKDQKKAFIYTKRAAEKDLAAAQFNLGVMYQNGSGTSQSFHNAAIWYEQAAKRNYALAQFNLALLYFDGLGVPKDIEMSYVWNRVAGYNGYKPAEKSMNLDAQQLSREQIKRAKARAEELYLELAPKKDDLFNPYQ